MRPIRARSWLRLAGTFLLTGFLLTACTLPFMEEKVTYNGGTFEPRQAAPAIDMTDQHGNPFSLSDLEGQVVLIYFGYTWCPDFCPTTLLDIQRVEQQLGDDAERLEVVFVSVDPERDTSERLQEYMEFFGPGYYAVRGSDEVTRETARVWGVTYAYRESEGASGYTVDHSTSLFAVDPDGNLALTWAYGTEVDLIVEDIQNLLKG
jgi:protein SCO1/2